MVLTFQPDAEDTDRWDVIVDGAQIGQIKKAFSSSRHGLARPVGYQSSFTSNGKRFNETHPRLNGLKSLIKAFIA